MEEKIKEKIEEIAEAIEWDFFIKVYIPRTNNINNAFRKIEQNHEKHKRSFRSNK